MIARLEFPLVNLEAVINAQLNALVTEIQTKTILMGWEYFSADQ
jgi:hypothetical protein